MVTASCAIVVASEARAQTRETVVIRGQPQSLHVYGSRGGIPAIVSSGDGGWIHLGPHVAEVLAARGFFVVGFDVKVYLERFTSGRTTLCPDDEPDDYKVIVDIAAGGTGRKPILIGVSEGAGLSVLAGVDPRMKTEISASDRPGDTDVNELGWRWKDNLIDSTDGIPNEPTFSVSGMVDRMAPVPFAAIHSTQDEFVPLAQVQRMMERAKDPKQLWIVKAADHRFSDNLGEFEQCLFEAITWITPTRGAVKPPPASVGVMRRARRAVRGRTPLFKCRRDRLSQAGRCRRGVRSPDRLSDACPSTCGWPAAARASLERHVLTDRHMCGGCEQ